ncbi:Gaa1-like protein [Zopfochytrium polystomum]|nr:Gaa1-like protein [Zopfochytrium polystomum]
MAPPTPKSLAQRRRIANGIASALARFSWLLYVTGIVWIGLFPMKQLQKYGYAGNIDENALLPGQASRYFGNSDANTAYMVVPNLIKLGKENRSVAIDFVADNLRSFGLDATVQKYWYRQSLTEKPREFSNLYAVVRSPRAAGTEAIMISAPWTCMTGEEYNHWSKDVVLFFPDGDLLGTKAFLEAYHGRFGQLTKDFSAEPLHYHGGVIEEAINIEFPGGGSYDQVGIFPVGLNGQQPNADMVMTMAVLAQYGGIPVTLHKQGHIDPQDAAWKEYLLKFGQVADYMKVQALGMPTSHHALYPRYKIEGLTLFGIQHENGGRGIDCIHIEQMLESAIRTFGNLLERLHHSFWFYIMSSIWTYIPIAFYIAPVIMLSITLAFRSLALWWDLDGFPYKTIEESNVLEGTKLLVRPASISTFSNIAKPIFAPALTLALCYAFGFAAALFPWDQLEIPTYPLHQIIFAAAAAALLCSSVVIPGVIATLSPIIHSRAGPNSSASWTTVLRSIACALMGITLLTVSAFNPSLSVFAALPSVPAFLLSSPSSRSPRSPIVAGLRMGLLLLASPVGVTAAASAFVGEDDVWMVLRTAFQSFKRLDGWLLPYVVALCWPLNLALQVAVMVDSA